MATAALQLISKKSKKHYPAFDVLFLSKNIFAERAIPREIMKSDAESDAPMSSEIFFEISSQTTNWIANCISHLLLCRIRNVDAVGSF